MGRLAMAAVLALGLSRPLPAGVEVTATGDRLNVVATHAPVSEVLEGLARKTRMKVVYEGPQPRTPVTVELRGRTPVQAVLGVLEGLGLNYLLVLAASGTEVETVIIVGAGARVASVPALVPARSSRRDAPPATHEEPPVEAEDEAEIEPAGSAVTHDVPKVDGIAKPAPAPVGPLNPTGLLPGSPPFAPVPPVRVTPAPMPTPPESN